MGIEKKNIALFIGSLQGGGAERVVSRLSEALGEYYDVTVILIDGADRQYDAGEKCIELGGTEGPFRKKAMRTCLKLRRVLKENNITCCISFLNAANFINILFSGRAKSIVSVRAYYSKEIYKKYNQGKAEKFEMWQFKHLYRYADAVVAVAQAMKESLRAEYSIPERKLCVIENPYDAKAILEQSAEFISEEAQRFIETHDTAVYVGRITTQKNPLLLIECFSKVVAIHKRAGLIILGDGNLRESTEALSDRLGLSENIWFAGRVKNPAAYVSKCKLFVSLSGYEGFPNALVEAMACGTPVMHTNCLSGPAEILGEKLQMQINEVKFAKFGVLLPDVGSYEKGRQESAIDDIAENWAELLSDDATLKRYSEAGIKRAEEYNYNAITSKWQKLIEGLF